MDSLELIGPEKTQFVDLDVTIALGLIPPSSL